MDTSIIGIHRYMRMLQTLWYIINVNQEEKGSKAVSLRNSTIYRLGARYLSVDPAKLASVGKVGLEPSKFLASNTIVFEFTQ